MAETLYPPHSRLFVACDKETTEHELKGVFQNYGTVINVNLCRDRSTGTNKGFAFIQFDKTSEAAGALEALNGQTIGHSSRPVKVTVALTKEQSGVPGGNDPSQFLRLFLVVSKTCTENELHNYFSKFGSIDSTTILRDRETKESKGYAYVKFRKFSDAARAFENCDRCFKVVFAKPKELSSGRSLESGASSGASIRESKRTCTHIEDNPEGYTCLRAMVSANLVDEQIEWLFDIAPGMEYVRFFNEPTYLDYSSVYMRKVLVQYDGPGTAAYAYRKLDGFEYPIGEKVLVRPDFSFTERMPSMESNSRKGQQPNAVSQLMQQVESLTKSLSEATRMLKSAGLNVPVPNMAGQVEAFRCSAKLPPPQPLAPPHSTCEERLFVVCEPGLPPQDALWDVFGRFGNLIDLYILNGKNCGYVKYANRNSAHRAIQTLNGQDLYRMKMKVLVAEPNREDRKRPRSSYD